MIPWNGITSVTFAYLLGSIPFGYLIVRWRSGTDVRSAGSGNIGATNVLRTSGRASGIATLVLDCGKGYFAVWLAAALTQHEERFMALAGLAATVGHVFSLYLKFKGGKGVATCLGVFLGLAWKPVAVSAVIFLATVLAWRYVSLASLAAAVSFPILYLLIGERPALADWTLVCGTFCSTLVILKHKDNIKRLLAGTEHRLTGSPKP
ncbi:MAG: glycerol-3-phosphate 1-O-acyltransferase PlsY [Acidobacteriota bacterium]